MSKFLPGDKVRIVKASYDWYWYANKIGHKITIKSQYVEGKTPSYWVEEFEEYTVAEADIELELAAKDEITTVDAVLHLQSLVDLTGDDVQIIIQENELFVKAFDKTFYCENAEVLEEVCKTISYLSRQETT